MEFNAQQIASYLGGTVEGNPEAAVKTFAKIEEGQEGATLVRVPNAYEAIARLLSLYESMTQKRTGIHPLACVSENATLGEGVYVGPFA